MYSSRAILNAPKDTDSTTFLDDVCQCMVTLAVKKCFLMLRQCLLCSRLCLLPLILSLSTSEKSLALSSLLLPLRYFYIL